MPPTPRIRSSVYFPRRTTPIRARADSRASSPSMSVAVPCVLVTVGRAARVDPADPRGTVGAVLALPDRHARLDAVDELAAGLERLAAMRCARGADDRCIPHGERADAVDGAHANALHLLLEL